MGRHDSLSLEQLRQWLRQHQRRLRAGDKLPGIPAIAECASTHRDNLYSLLEGNRIEVRTQTLLSRAIMEIEAETAAMPKTKLMTISLTGSVPRLQVGLPARPAWMQ